MSCVHHLNPIVAYGFLTVFMLLGAAIIWLALNSFKPPLYPWEDEE